MAVRELQAEFLEGRDRSCEVVHHNADVVQPLECQPAECPLSIELYSRARSAVGSVAKIVQPAANPLDHGTNFIRGGGPIGIMPMCLIGSAYTIDSE